MARALILVLGVLAAPITAAAQQPAPFRVAAIGADAPCAAPGAQTPAAARAYATHLSARLKRPVHLCGFAQSAAAGAALAAGGVDLGLLDAGGFGAHQTSLRAILAGRPSAGPGRALTVLITRAADARATPAAFASARLVLGGTGPLMQDAPLSALAQAGLSPATPPRVVPGSEAALAAVRSGAADAAILDAASVTRECRADDATSRPCADLREVWRGRPRPALAWAVRRDMAEALRFQIIGIHIALHQEAPAAAPFALAGMTGAELLEPAEANALIDASQKVRAW
jgi:ABC-type phosphate/phosphonate transport system substrate-binding protein